MSLRRQGINTRFVTGCGLANELLEARQGITLSRIINRYAPYGMLVLDELGDVPFSKEGMALLFQVLAKRHERGGCGHYVQPGLYRLGPGLRRAHPPRFLHRLIEIPAVGWNDIDAESSGKSVAAGAWRAAPAQAAAGI